MNETFSRYNPFMRVFLLAALFCSTAFGWGCEGHQMVALIARAHLSPHASAEVDRLLAASPVDPDLKRFCATRMQDQTGSADPMAADATWADDVRAARKNGPWHFIDIPRTETEPNVMKYCPALGTPSATGELPGCVINAIQAQLAVLSDASAPVRNRAEALRYVIHFVGDLHQPLHTTDNNDHGGNCTRLQFYDLAHPTNLHAVWDYNIIEHDVTARHLTVAQDARSIDQKNSADWKTWGQPPADLNAWAWEGHGIANDVVYGKLAPPIPMEQPSATDVCPAETQKVQDLNIAIGDAYENAAVPVVEGQIARAGYRLAGILNRVWP